MSISGQTNKTSRDEYFDKIYQSKNRLQTDPILVKLGLRQGDAMSPIRFNIVLEKAIRKANILPQEGVKFQRLSIELSTYANLYLVIIEETQDG